MSAPGAAGDRRRRLLERLAGARAPLVVAWGLPGWGQLELLDTLTAASGDPGIGTVVALAPAELADPERRRRALERVLGRDLGRDLGRATDDGAAWLTCPMPPAPADLAATLADLAHELPADRRLLVAAVGRPDLGELPAETVDPAALAWSEDEIEALVEATVGEAPGGLETAAVAGRLRELTGGWERPLRLALEHWSRVGAGAFRLPGDGARLAAAVPALAAFLDADVAPRLEDGERTALGRVASGAISAAGTLEPLLRRWGLEGGGEGLVGAVGLLAAALPSTRRRVGLPPSAGVAEPSPGGTVRARLELLGPPRVTGRGHDGWRRLHWPLKRAFRALAFLATSPDRRATRQELEEALFSEASEATIQSNFHPTLSHLRRGLRGPAQGRGSGGDDGVPAVVFEDGVYRLDPAYGWWIDVDDHAAAAAAGRRLAGAGRDAEAAAELARAWGLHRGELLEGLEERWVGERRAAVRRRHLAVLRELGAVRSRLGDRDGAVDALRAALADDPLQERLHADLMRLYAGQGRRDLLRRQYERLTILLREELGVEPLDETTRTFHELLAELG